MFENLKHILLKHKPIGRSFVKTVKNFDINLHNNLPKERYSEALYKKLNMPNLGCKVCGRPTTFKTFYKGYLPFCSNGCAHTESNRGRPHRKLISKLDKIFVRKINNLDYDIVYKKYREQINILSKQLNVKPSLIIYHMFIDNKIKLCDTCGDPTNFLGTIVGYSQFCCIKCSDTGEAVKNKIIKRKETNLKRYGVKNVQQLKWVGDKYKKTMQKRYGVDNPMKNSKIRRKVADTNLERYGVENVFANKDIQVKIKSVNMKRYGVEYAQQSSKIRKKTRISFMKKYGVDNNLKSPKIQKQIREDCFSKTGYYHHFHNPKIFKKVQESFRQTHNITLDGKKFKYKGYEKFLLKYLVDRFYPEDVKNSVEDMPIIYWKLNEREHRYWPDVRIGNTLYEVKSPYTLGVRLGGRKIFDVVQAKAKASINAGFKFKCVVYDGSGKLLLVDDLQKLRIYYCKLLSNCKD